MAYDQPDGYYVNSLFKKLKPTVNYSTKLEIRFQLWAKAFKVKEPFGAGETGKYFQIYSFYQILISGE